MWCVKMNDRWFVVSDAGKVQEDMQLLYREGDWCVPYTVLFHQL